MLKFISLFLDDGTSRKPKSSLIPSQEIHIRLDLSNPRVKARPLEEVLECQFRNLACIYLNMFFGVASLNSFLTVLIDIKPLEAVLSQKGAACGSQLTCSKGAIGVPFPSFNF